MTINIDGDTCLHLAAMRGNKDIVKIFLHEPRIDPMAINIKGILACTMQILSCLIVQLLLDDPRIDPMAINIGGNTCLHIAADGRHVDIVKIFLKDSRIHTMAINTNGKIFSYNQTIYQ
jgi:ankyrin repeat protein